MDAITMMWQYIYSLGPMIGIYAFLIITLPIVCGIAYKKGRRDLKKEIHEHLDEKSRAVVREIKTELKYVRLELQRTKKQRERLLDITRGIRSIVNQTNHIDIIEKTDI